MDRRSLLISVALTATLVPLCSPRAAAGVYAPSALQSALQGLGAAMQSYAQGVYQREQAKVYFDSILKMSLGQSYSTILHAWGSPYKLHQHKSTWSAEYGEGRMRFEFFFDGSKTLPSHGSVMNYAMDRDSEVIQDKYWLSGG